MTTPEPQPFLLFPLPSLLAPDTLAGAAAPSAGRHEREDPGGRSPVSSISPTLLPLHVKQGERCGHPMWTPVLLGVHRGVVPDEPGVPAV